MLQIKVLYRLLLKDLTKKKYLYTMSRKPIVTREIQTNAPEYQESLKEKHIDMYMGTTIKNQLDENMEFATPREKSKTCKIIHKEKLTTVKQNNITVQGHSSGHTLLPTATATVISSTSTPPRSSAVKTLNYVNHYSVSDSNLRRTNSSEFKVVNSHQNNLECDSNEAFYANPKRWNSYQNILKEKSEFKELAIDPNTTVVQDSSPIEKYPESSDSFDKLGFVSLRETSHMKSASAQNLSSIHESTGYSLPDYGNNSKSSLQDENVYPYSSYQTKDIYGRRDDYRTSGYSVAPQSQRTLYSHSFSSLPPRPLPYHSPSYGGEFDMGGVCQGQSNSLASDPRDLFTNDITNWQQKHQDQLRRQQYETSQAMYNGSNPHNGNGLSTSGSATMLASDPHKLDAVKRAADNIIKEKDAIIEKQKIKLLQLEKHSREAETDLTRALLKKVEEEGEHLHFKLQEAKYEAASFKAQLAEATSNKNTDFGSLEKKLGQREYEFQQYKIKMEKEINQKKQDIALLQDRLNEKENTAQQWKDKYTTINESYETVKNKLENVERYMGDLPTIDESSQKENEIHSLKEEKSRLKARAAELEKRLADASKSVKSRDAVIEKLEEKEQLINRSMERLKMDNARLKSALGLNEGDDIPTRTEEEVEEIKDDNKRLKSDCEKAKKLLESKHKKLQQQELKYKTAMKELEERLEQEEASVNAMREELGAKDQQVKKLRASVKELGTQNQDLMEKNMVLQDKLKECEKLKSGDTYKLEKRLMKEMNICFSDLQSLVQICVQRAEGQDPNISVLLGVKGSSPQTDFEEDFSDKVQAIKHKISKIRELRQEVDKIKELISNKYAEDMGDNLNCTTQ